MGATASRFTNTLPLHTLLCSLLASVLFTGVANAEKDTETREQPRHEREESKYEHQEGQHERGGKHHGMRRAQQLITDYKLENGDITQAEVDAHREAYKAMRAELKALKASGDTEALEAKRAVMKEQFKAKHADNRAYVEAHPELKAKLKALHKSRDKGHHGNKREKMKRIHEIVTAYKLKQGDITLDEITQAQQERDAIHAEFKQLKADGDTDALEAKRKAMKETFKAKRTALHDYIEANPELKEQLKAERKAMRKTKKEDDKD